MIDKGKAVDKLQTLKGDAKGLEASVFNACIKGIKEMPEDDGIEIVRCKECEYWRSEFLEDYGKCDMHCGLFELSGNDFCSYGKKRGADK